MLQTIARHMNITNQRHTENEVDVDTNGNSSSAGSKAPRAMAHAVFPTVNVLPPSKQMRAAQPIMSCVGSGEQCITDSDKYTSLNHVKITGTESHTTRLLTYRYQEYRFTASKAVSVLFRSLGTVVEKLNQYTYLVERVHDEAVVAMSLQVTVFQWFGVAHVVMLSVLQTCVVAVATEATNQQICPSRLTEQLTYVRKG